MVTLRSSRFVVLTASIFLIPQVNASESASAPSLEMDLVSVDTATRNAALTKAAAADEAEKKEIVPAMIRLLEGEDASVATRAKAALVALSTASVPGLIEFLEEDRDETDQVRAIITLAEIGTPSKSAVPILTKHLSARFGGLGMKLLPWRESLMVEPIEGHAAFRAGLKRHDIVVAVDGTPVSSIPLSQVVKRLRGRPGSWVALTIRRQTSGYPVAHGQPEVLRVRREGIENSRLVALAADALARLGQEAKPAIPALWRVVLENKNPDAITYAISALFAIDHSSGKYVSACLKELDRDRRPNIGAVLMLSRLGPIAQPAIPRLIRSLKDMNAELGDYDVIVSALRSAGPPAPSQIPILIDYLSSENVLIRVEALNALSIYRPMSRDILERIVSVFAGPDSHACQRAYEILPKLDGVDSTLIPAIFEAILVDQSDCVGFALSIVQRIQPPGINAVPVLIRALSHPSPHARNTAAQLLGNIGPEAKIAIPDIIEGACSHGMPNEFVGALPKIGDEGIPLLLAGISKAAGEKNIDRLNCMEFSLSAYGPRAVPDLMRLASDPNPLIRGGAEFSLHRIGPRASAAVPVLIRNLGLPDDISAKGALVAIGTAAVPALIIALDDPIPGARHGAAVALKGIGAGASAAAPALVRRTNDPDYKVWTAAIDALGSIGPTGAEGLVDCLKNKPKRILAMSALRQLGPAAKEAAPALIKLLEAGDVQERQAAVNALKSIGSSSARVVPALTRALTDTDLGVRNLTQAALRFIGTPSALKALEKHREIH